MRAFAGFTLICWCVAAAIVFWMIQPAAAPKMADYVQCMDAETREDLRTVMREGISQAMRTHTVRMFDNWMKDPNDQPGRAVTGMHNAVRAYVGSLKVLNEWSPPPC
ncbi:hypothetical protein EHM76_04265 [bacterium]|nr:MAG: hypothetical protein EHM76_04265 [bacterium]